MTFRMQCGATLVRRFAAAARSAGPTDNTMTHGTHNEHSRQHDARHARTQTAMAAACATCRARGACNFDAVNLAAMLDAHIPIVANQALPCTRGSGPVHCMAALPAEAPQCARPVPLPCALRWSLCSVLRRMRRCTAHWRA